MVPWLLTDGCMAIQAFAAESPDPSKGRLCIVEAKPLPARHTISTVRPAAADRVRKSIMRVFGFCHVLP
jgi:hypothetical protein